jgi:hypothetical protein
MLTYRGHGVTTCEVVVDRVVGATGDVVVGAANVVVGATSDVVFGVDKATDNVVVEKHVGHVVFVATKNAARSDGHLK